MPKRKGDTYYKLPCSICGRMIAVAGFAQWNHAEAHRRRGETAPKPTEKCEEPDA